MARSRLQKLGAYLGPHRPQAALGVGALFLVNILGVWIPLLIRDGIDELQVSFSYGRVLYYAIMVLVLASVMWGIRMVSRITLFGVGRQVEFDLKQRIFEHLLRMEPAYFSRNTPGELISRATSDVDNIRRLLGFAILSLANIVFAYALTIPVMLSISVRLTLISLAIYPLMLFLVQVFSNRLRLEQLEVQERLSRLSDLIQEDMSGIALIKIYAQEENERQAFQRLNQDLLRANLILSKTRNTLFPLLGGLASISLLVILATGAGSITRGYITVGGFVALLLYVERLVFPTALLGFTITAYQRGEVSIDRVEAILEAEPKVQDHPPLQPPAHHRGAGTTGSPQLKLHLSGQHHPSRRSGELYHSAGGTDCHRWPHRIGQIHLGQCPTPPVRGGAEPTHPRPSRCGGCAPARPAAGHCLRTPGQLFI